MDSLHAAGARLANIAFNLAQDRKLSDRTREILIDAYKGWDEAVSATAVGSNERESFERASRAIGWPDAALARGASGLYQIAYTEWSWKLWQARAALPNGGAR